MRSAVSQSKIPSKHGWRALASAELNLISLSPSHADPTSTSSVLHGLDVSLRPPAPQTLTINLDPLSHPTKKYNVAHSLLLRYPDGSSSPASCHLGLANPSYTRTRLFAIDTPCNPSRASTSKGQTRRLPRRRPVRSGKRGAWDASRRLDRRRHLASRHLRRL